MEPAEDGKEYLVTNGIDLAALAAGDAPMLLLGRFPVVSIRHEKQNAGLKYGGELSNGIDLSDSLLDRTQPVSPVFVIHGHLHVRHAITRNGILQASCAAPAESLFEATVFDLGSWSEGRVSWNSTSMQEESTGRRPSLAEPFRVRVNSMLTLSGADMESARTKTHAPRRGRSRGCRRCQKLHREASSVPVALLAISVASSRINGDRARARQSTRSR